MLAMIFQAPSACTEAAAGGIGAAILNGFKRGLFSNEAGMGSAPNAAAATALPPHPASQGYMQMAGVFIDTMLIAPRPPPSSRSPARSGAPASAWFKTR